ncbi:MAG: hypothetical protein ACXQTS_02925 [Candidatus Methanospirareceae archaeon]
MREKEPLKHVLVFKWKFEEARSMEDIEERFKGYYFVVKPREDILVTTTFISPYVICVLMRKDEEGGDLIIIQTFAGRYDYERMFNGAFFYAMRAGIRLIDVEYPEDLPKPYFMEPGYRM